MGVEPECYNRNGSCRFKDSGAERVGFYALSFGFVVNARTLTTQMHRRQSIHVYPRIMRDSRSASAFRSSSEWVTYRSLIFVVVCPSTAAMPVS